MFLVTRAKFLESLLNDERWSLTCFLYSLIALVRPLQVLLACKGRFYGKYYYLTQCRMASIILSTFHFTHSFALELTVEDTLS